jgi:predicted aldo/keto reductase-like oxidoreductase
MLSYRDILNLIRESSITLIGYTSRDEKLKDELISKFSYVEISKIDSSFDFKSFLRDKKLDSVLDGVGLPEFLLIDINNIRNIEPIGRSQQIGRVLQKIQEEMLQNYTYPMPKLILTTPCYKSVNISDTGSVYNFSGGNSALYQSEVAMSIVDSELRVIKNRRGRDGENILYKFEKN